MIHFFSIDARSMQAQCAYRQVTGESFGTLEMTQACIVKQKKAEGEKAKQKAP